MHTGWTELERRTPQRRWPAHSLWLMGAICVAGCGSSASDAVDPSRPAEPVVQPAAPETNAEGVPAPPRVAARAEDWFEDVTDSTHIDFTHRTGREAGLFLQIESFGGGVATFDYDGDDLCDVFVTGGGLIEGGPPGTLRGVPAGLFRNQGNWQFQAVTGPAGVGTPTDYSQGCTTCDFNADGFPDVLVTCLPRSRLYENAGDGTFSEVSPQALPAPGWGTAAAFGDWDADGLPDLLLTRYTEWSPETEVVCFGGNHERDMCGPTSYAGTTSLYYHNAGDGTFVDRSEALGLTDVVHGLGVIAGDLNLDGWVDFYVASDTLANKLYLGGRDAKLIDRALEAGVALGEWGQPEASMGVDVNDFDGDGLPDIFITNFEKEDHAFYRNLGEGLWAHATVSSGLSASTRLRVGFGTSFCDFDGDRWPDLFVLNGNTIYMTGESPFAQKAQLFRNENGRRFVEVSHMGGPYFHEPHAGRGSAVADLDNDGDLDLVLVLVNEPVRVLRNRCAAKPYVRVELVATEGDREAVGARVVCRTGGRPCTQFVIRGGSYFSQSDDRVMFALQDGSTEATVTVAWPGRSTETFSDLAAGETHTLVEGRGVAAHAGP